MPYKKTNVLNRFFCVFKPKKSPCDDIVSMADKVIEDYIYSKNKLIHRKCKKDNSGFLIFSLMLAASLGLSLIFFSLI